MMRSIKKVFFLGAAFAFVALVLMPQEAGAAGWATTTGTSIQGENKITQNSSILYKSFDLQSSGTGDHNLTQISGLTIIDVDASGTVNTDIKKVSLWLETTNIPSPDGWSAQDSFIASKTGISIGTQFTIDFNPVLISGTRRIYLILDVSDSAIQGHKMALQNVGTSLVGTPAGLTAQIIGSPSTDFVIVQNKKAGDQCNPRAQTSECINGTLCEPELGGICIPIVENRKIGTYCTEAKHCKLGTDTLTLTCDDTQHACVGATNNVSCADSVVNQNPNFGKTKDQLASDQRCDTGLVCDAQELKCVNDFGQGEVPGDKLGDAATDIRDQIRNLINIALGFLGVAGVIVTLYGGFTWMTAFGDDEKVGKAKKTIVAGIIGIVIIGVAWTIVSYVLKVAEKVA